jgi:hypothetical protein
MINLDDVPDGIKELISSSGSAARPQRDACAFPTR